MKLNRTIILSLLSLSLFSCHQANAQSQAESGKIPGTVLFGSYPQKSKSAEPIKWTVLESDGDKVLLLSDSCIDSLPFSKSYVLGVFGSYDEMASASVGDTVTITGSFHIMSSENMVVLKRCKILQVS